MCVHAAVYPACRPDRHSRLAAVGEEVAFGPVGAGRRVRIRPRRKPCPLTSIRSGVLERGRHVVLVHVEHDGDPGPGETGNGSVKRVQIRSIPAVDDGTGGINSRPGRFEVRPAEPQPDRVEALPGNVAVFGRRGQQPTLATRVRVRAVVPLPTDQPGLIHPEEPHRPAGRVHDPPPARPQPARDERRARSRGAGVTRPSTRPSQHRRRQPGRGPAASTHSRMIRAGVLHAPRSQSVLSYPPRYIPWVLWPTPSERRQPRPRRVQQRVARVPGDVRNELLNVTHRGSPTT